MEVSLVGRWLWQRCGDRSMGDSKRRLLTDANRMQISADEEATSKQLQMSLTSHPEISAAGLPYLIFCMEPAVYDVNEQTLHCVSKSDTGVIHYNFDIHQPILIIFVRDVAERIRHQMVLVIPPLLTNVSALPGKTWTPEIVSSIMLCTVSGKRNG